MGLELLFLGTGTSAGVPMIGCDCAVCRSPNPRNHRSRASVLVCHPDPALAAGERCGHTGQMLPPRPRRMLIDTSPELRLQMIQAGVGRIDGVFYTHTHADHIFGLDDVRRFNAVMNTHMPIYGERAVIDWLRETFRYIFEPHRNANLSFIPQLMTIPLRTDTPLELHGACWTPLRLLHGKLPMLGYRVDFGGSSLAYCTDVSAIPPETYPLLKGLDVLVIDGLRHRHHPTHMTVEQALREIDQVQPGRAYLTHIAHDIDHDTLEAALPRGVHVAYDGLRVVAGAPDGPRIQPRVGNGTSMAAQQGGA